MLLVEGTQLIAISYLEHPHGVKGLQYARAADLYQISYLPLWHIFVYLWPGCTVAPSARTTWKNGKKYSAAMSK